MEKRRVLLAEDDSSLAALLGLELRKAGFDLSTAKSGAEAVRALTKGMFDVVITDLKLGDMDGLEVLAAAKRGADSEVVVITGHGSIDTAVSAMKAGAFDYLTKPVEPEELTLVIKKALEHRDLLGELRRLREEVKDKYGVEGIVYSGPQMQRVLDLVRKVAATDATVIILGESGTGKELIARAVHAQSPRRDGAFIAVNCGALPEGLLESELFGHVKGSFTGADRNKRGLFEEASGGTLFLDEISETTPALQVKLLRALQEGEVRRVGDNHPIKVSTRIVTATNRDLAKFVSQGKFREDLYYRLKVFPIQLPSLRERPEDILPLAEHFLRRIEKKAGSKPRKLSAEAAAALKDYAWPGNVRELEHAIERALIMATGAQVRADDLPSELLAQAPTPVGARSTVVTLEAVERKHILDTLAACGDNAADAAKNLGIGRNTLWRKLKAYGVTPK